jgi:uncharacterized membrane protein
MPTTAWRFRSTEGADDALVKLKGLDAQDLVNVRDVAVIRWPGYASQPMTQQHATDEGGKVSSMASRLRKGSIDTAMIEAVKGDISPGTSALVLLSSGTAIDKVAEAFRAQGMELIRSDLSVQQQDQIRAAFSGSADKYRDQRS